MGIQTRRRSLLLLEDDPHLAPMVAELLADHYDVTVVGDGQRALQLAGDGQFDVLVLDRRVPSVDGVEVVRRLRAVHVRTPALLLTAQTTARPVPVFPLVNSITVPPFCSRPVASASSMILSAMRSLILKPGLKNSIFNRIRPGKPAPMRSKATNGVFPMASRMLDRT